MSFIWPPMLLSLLLVPLGLGLSRFLELRRRRRLAAYGGRLALGASGRRGFRSRIPAVFFVVAMVLMSVALARPQAVVSLPRQEGTVILAFDVSASMAATDLAPTRIAAAKAAAKDFVTRQPVTITVGVVAFSDSGVSVQPPTNDQPTVLAAIDRLTPQHGTSVAQGITASLKAIAAAEAGPFSGDYYTNSTPGPSPTEAPTPTPVPNGYHAPAVIVLLSDGENNENPDPVAAAQAASDLGVRIYTVGIGTSAGTVVTVNGFQEYTQMNEASLRAIADTTGGTYYSATDADQLRAIYDSIDTQVILQPQMTEITSLLAALSLLLFLAGAITSLLWLGRLL